eukprot:scaffold2558_cov18-Tisochrysis_lutea.AAC.2
MAVCGCTMHAPCFATYLRSCKSLVGVPANQSRLPCHVPAELDASDVNQLTQAMKSTRAGQANSNRTSGYNVPVHGHSQRRRMASKPSSQAASTSHSHAPSRKASRSNLSEPLSNASPGSKSKVGGAGGRESGRDVSLPGEEDEDELFPVDYPEPIALTDSEFDAAVAEGRLLEHHRELFVHSMDTHRMGVTKEAIKEVNAA